MKKRLTSIEHSSFPQPCNFLIKIIYFPEQSDNNQGFQLVYASLPFKEPSLDLKVKIILIYISYMYPCSKLTVHFFLFSACPYLYVPLLSLQS